MRAEAILLNGVYESVLKEILDIQSILPDQILFLQPYSSRPIVELQLHPPTIDDRVLLYMSVTDDLPTIRYTAEIIGWDDKQKIKPRKRELIDRIIKSLQPQEGKLFDMSMAKEGSSINLLSIRNLKKLEAPFRVDELNKVIVDEPVSTGRTTAGGWVYVKVKK